jgi:hypothetical protein
MKTGKRPQKNKTLSPKGTIRDAIAELKVSHGLVEQASSSDDIVDIVKFCERPDLLNLPANNLNLFISQRVVLKCLYLGSRGNEDLQLTDEEVQWLKDKKQDNVLKMLHDRSKGGVRRRVSELTLVLGRRASKTVIASIISAYEVYKLLKVGKGDPYNFYGIAYDEEIAILNVATSRKQAGRLFAQIKARLRNSPFFREKIAKVTSDEIRLYTDIDLRKLKESEDTVPVEGSVVIVCGHSNPDSLRGYTVICLIFDELAFYDESEKISGTDFYEALAPSVHDFASRGDGLIVEISTPGPKTGIFYKLWKNSFEVDGMMSFKMATWDFNPNKPYDDPELTKFRKLDPDGFDVEFGAEWPEGGVYGIYFPEELLAKTLKIDLAPETEPVFGCEYYMHVDPGLSADRYCVAIVRKTVYHDSGGNLSPRVILAMTKAYDPESQGVGLNYEKIEADLLDMCRKFNPILVTFDQWNSIGSLQMLQRNGFNTRQTTFNRGYKNRIYQNLKDLMAKPELGLWLYDDQLLMTELRNLKYRPTARGMSIGADKRGDCPTDDMADCLAGAAFMASGHHHARLPEVLTVYTGMR